jgi:hypothetical protein
VRCSVSLELVESHVGKGDRKVVPNRGFHALIGLQQPEVTLFEPMQVHAESSRQ